MATFSKIGLSAAPGGTGIKVTGTTSGSTTIHATGTSATVEDEIWLYAYNSDASSAVTLTIQFGGTTSPDNDIKVPINPQSGLVLVVPGLILTGTGAAARTVYAYASSANLITISGYVNRIA